MLAITVWWLVDARKWFKGPKVNIEHAMLGRQDNVIEAKIDQSGGSSNNSITREMATTKGADLA